MPRSTRAKANDTASPMKIIHEDAIECRGINSRNARLTEQIIIVPPIRIAHLTKVIIYLAPLMTTIRLEHLCVSMALASRVRSTNPVKKEAQFWQSQDA